MYIAVYGRWRNVPRGEASLAVAAIGPPNNVGDREFKSWCEGNLVRWRKAPSSLSIFSAIANIKIPLPLSLARIYRTRLVAFLSRPILLLLRLLGWSEGSAHDFRGNRIIINCNSFVPWSAFSFEHFELSVYSFPGVSWLNFAICVGLTLLSHLICSCLLILTFLQSFSVIIVHGTWGHMLFGGLGICRRGRFSCSESIAFHWDHVIRSIPSLNELSGCFMLM